MIKIHDDIFLLLKKYIRSSYYDMKKGISLFFHQQISWVLPRSHWGVLVLEKNNEELVSFTHSERILKGLVKKDYHVDMRVRKTVAEKLVYVSQKLPKGYSLVLIEGYRSLTHQTYGWNQKCNALRNEHPDWSDEYIEGQARLVTAKPSIHANHITGGAVDVTLCDQEGKMLDMGTPYPTHLGDIVYLKKFPMFASGLTSEQKYHRKLLRDAMTAAGFVYYPGEWWHYCYGDRMWAAYTGCKTYFYEGIEDEK